MTLDPLTKRFLKYRVSSDEFGTAFLGKAFVALVPQASKPDRATNLEMAG